GGPIVWRCSQVPEGFRILRGTRAAKEGGKPSPPQRLLCGVEIGERAGRSETPQLTSLNPARRFFVKGTLNHLNPLSVASCSLFALVARSGSGPGNGTCWPGP